MSATPGINGSGHAKVNGPPRRLTPERRNQLRAR